MNPAREALTRAVKSAIAEGAAPILAETTAPTMAFRDLPIGATFDFVPPNAVPGAVSFFDRCQKTSARLYQSLALPKAYAYQIGAVTCTVYNVDLADAGHILTADEIAARLEA